ILGSYAAAVLSTATALPLHDALPISASGALTISDVDNASEYTPATVGGSYGSLTIDATGAWSYTASSAHNEFVAGTTYSDTFTVDGEGRRLNSSHGQISYADVWVKQS